MYLWLKQYNIKIVSILCSLLRHVAIIASKTHAIELTRVMGTASVAVIRRLTLENCVTAESKTLTQPQQSTPTKLNSPIPSHWFICTFKMY